LTRHTFGRFSQEVEEARPQELPTRPEAPASAPEPEGEKPANPEQPKPPEPSGSDETNPYA
jgi:hypothetical protein